MNELHTFCFWRNINTCLYCICVCETCFFFSSSAVMGRCVNGYVYVFYTPQFVRIQFDCVDMFFIGAYRMMTIFCRQLALPNKISAHQRNIGIWSEIIINAYCSPLSVVSPLIECENISCTRHRVILGHSLLSPIVINYHRVHSIKCFLAWWHAYHCQIIISPCGALPHSPLLSSMPDPFGHSVVESTW